MDFFIFYKKWFLILFEGWKTFLLFLVHSCFWIIRRVHYSFWILIFSSFLLILFVLLPWFSYTIELNEIETIFLRTKKWYIFVIPAFSSILFLLIYHKIIYKIQVIINFIIITLYLYGFYNNEYHILVKGKYQILYNFYFYFIVLIFHTFAIDALKRKNNFIFNQIQLLWKTKIKNNL
ncbi:MAG: hypothetical protein KatS3mg129_2003 [Leptospiraceae bacterium]|nr:MAG: hypothetical protein KatS3mg129_2003 [Leptospiraceae bacterium]